MNFFKLITPAAFAFLHLTSYGQADVILKGNDVNEAMLIEALTPEPKLQSRSIRITPDGGGSTPVKRASASMLITFQTNSAELTPQAKKMLASLGKAMTSDKLSNFKFSIEGHPDPRGGEQFNLQLSQTRAETVVGFLTENYSIAPGRLQPVGKGQSELVNVAQPFAPENRRVTVKTVVE